MKETPDSIETLLVTIIQKHGGPELYKKENAHKLSGLLKDYAGFYFQDELRLLTRIIPDGFQEILFKANEGSLEEKKGAITECKMRLVDVSFLSQEKAEEAANIFAKGLGWKLEEGAQKSKIFGDFSDLIGISESKFSEIFDSIFEKKASDNSASAKPEGIVVGKNSDFHTLGEAVKAAKNGDSIKVLPGLYIEPEDSPLTEISKKITITGCKENIADKDFSKLPVIVLSSKKSCKITADVTIEGVVFTSDKDISFKTINECLSNPPEFSGAEYRDDDSGMFNVTVNAVLKNIAILRHKSLGICFSGGNAVLSDSIISQCYGPSILCAHKDAAPSVENCRIAFSNNSVKIEEKSRPSFSNCEIYNNIYRAVCIYSASGSFTNCWIHDNGVDAVEMSNSDTKFTGCYFYNNGKIGVCCNFEIGYANRSPEFLNCKIYNTNLDYSVKYGTYRDGEDKNEEFCSGICIDFSMLSYNSSNPNPIFNNCEIYRNSGYGIYYSEGCSCGIIENCSIHDNGKQGIYTDDDIAKIKNCNIYGNGE